MFCKVLLLKQTMRKPLYNSIFQDFLTPELHSGKLKMSCNLLFLLQCCLCLLANTWKYQSIILQKRQSEGGRHAVSTLHDFSISHLLKKTTAKKKKIPSSVPESISSSLLKSCLKKRQRISNLTLHVKNKTFIQLPYLPPLRNAH